MAQWRNFYSLGCCGTRDRHIVPIAREILCRQCPILEIRDPVVRRLGNGFGSRFSVREPKSSQQAFGPMNMRFEGHSD